MQETVQFLGWKDPLEERVATHFSSLAWRIPWTEKPDALQSIGLQSWALLKQLVCTHAQGCRAFWVAQTVKNLPAIQKTWIQFLGQETWVGERAWTTRRSTHSILKETNPEYSLERLILKLKHQYFGHLMRRADSWEKTLILGKIEDRRKGQQKTKWLDGIFNSMEFEQTPGDSEGQRSVACCSRCSCKESDLTELLNNTGL